MINWPHLGETAIMVLLAYVVGCIIGYAARRIAHAARGRRRLPPDNLQAIKGIGPKLAAALNATGVFRHAQIAAWDEAEVQRMDVLLASKGRIVRDNWVGQARQLAQATRPDSEVLMPSTNAATASISSR